MLRCLTVLAVIFAGFAAYSALMSFIGNAFQFEDELDRYLLSKGVFALAILAAAFAFGRQKAWGLVARIRWKALPLYWPMAAILLLIIAGAKEPASAPATIGVLFLIALSIGIGEELLFRGWLLDEARALTPRVQITLSAVGFGTIHLLGLGKGIPTEVIFAQVFFATALGLIFAYARLRDYSILLAIAVHSLFDFGAFVASGGIGKTLNNPEQIVIGLLFTGTIAMLCGFFLVYRAGKTLPLRD